MPVSIEIFSRVSTLFPSDHLLAIVLGVVFIALIFASISDLLTREVADWLNYGLLSFAIFVRMVYSIMDWSYIPLLDGLIGFLFAFLIASGMFYLGQWGGGDSKLLISLGTLFGLSSQGVFSDGISSILFNNVLPIFILNIFLCGALYGLVWSIYLAVRNRKVFKKTYDKYTSQPTFKTIRVCMLIVILITIPVSFFMDLIFRLLFLACALLLLLSIYLILFVRTLEQSCMIKLIPITKLTEGDWIFEDVRVKGKLIAGPKDLGISKEQIELLLEYNQQGIIHKIKVKEGIPFVPSFLFGFILSLLIGNWLNLLFF